MQPLSPYNIISAPLGLNRCHGLPRRSHTSSSTRIQNNCSISQKFVSKSNNSSSSSKKSSHMVHSLITSVLQLASNNIIPSSSSFLERSDNVTAITIKNANVEFTKLDLLPHSSLLQSTTKSLLSEMLNKQVEQRINKNQLSQMQRKPIIIPTTKRLENTENTKANNQSNNHVITNAATKTKSLKFGNCPLVVRTHRKDELSSRNDTPIVDYECKKQDDTTAVSISIVATRKTSFATSPQIIRARNDKNIIKSIKPFSPPPIQKVDIKNDESMESEEENMDSDDDGYIEDNEDDEDDENMDSDDDGYIEDNEDDEDDEDEDEDNGNTEINYEEHLSMLINQPPRSIKSILNNNKNTSTTTVTSITCNTSATNGVNTSTTPISTSPTSYKYATSPQTISENVSNDNDHDDNAQCNTLNNHLSKLVSASRIQRKVKSLPPYDLSLNVAKVKIDSRPINWNVNTKKGIPIPRTSINNIHYKCKKQRCNRFVEDPEDVNDDNKMEGFREVRNGEEGMFWPMSI